GMRAASSAYGVPIVGGHTTRHSQPGDRVTLAAEYLGRAGPRLLTSIDAEVDDCLEIFDDTAGAYRKDKPFWTASTTSEPEKLRRLMGLLPKLAERGLCRAAKDISNGGIVGTLAMFTESSKVGALLDLDTLYRPRDTAWLKWLTSFPSFGYLLAIPAKHLTEVRALFALEPSVFVESVGRFIEERSLIIAQGGELENLQFPQMP
ncbi:MAG: AIR synthase-related protein, partial [Verrucomicrobiota bacterium]